MTTALLLIREKVGTQSSNFELCAPPQKIFGWKRGQRMAEWRLTGCRVHRPASPHTGSSRVSLEPSSGKLIHTDPFGMKMLCQHQPVFPTASLARLSEDLSGGAGEVFTESQLTLLMALKSS